MTPAVSWWRAHYLDKKEHHSQERAVAELSYLANECGNDMEAYCSDIKPGEGRLLQYIDKNDANVSKRCKQALKDTGLKKYVIPERSSSSLSGRRGKKIWSEG